MNTTALQICPICGAPDDRPHWSGCQDARDFFAALHQPEARYAIRSKTTAWRHQQAAYDFAYPLHGALLGMEMGTGKSKVTVDLIVNRGHRYTLILCPLSVVNVWPHQFNTHAAEPVRCLPLAVGSVKQKQERCAAFLRQAFVDKAMAVVVLNYDSAWRPPLADYLARIPLECLVMDESHRIKSPAGRASQFCWRLAQKIPWKLALTGTPMPHSPLDIYAQYRALESGVFGLNYHAFRQRYAVLGGWEGKQIIGWKNEAELNQKIYRLAFRCGKEVLDLPPVVHETRTCQLTPKAMRVYRQLEEELRADLDTGEVTAANALVRLLRLQQITSGYVKTTDESEVEIDTGKRDALADLLEDLDEPVVVFGRFQHDLDSVHLAAATLKRPSLELSGRKNQLAAWQTASGNEVLAVQIQAGGVGVDLTRARVCVYFSVGFSLGDYLQSLARVHRPGQDRSVLYVHLLAEGTVDELVYKRLDERQELIDGILKDLRKEHADAQEQTTLGSADRD